MMRKPHYNILRQSEVPDPREIYALYNKLSFKMCGMEINIEKLQVMSISRSNESLQIKIGNRELKEVDHFKYLGSLLTRDGYCVREIMIIAVSI